MAIAFSYKDAEQKIQLLNIPGMIKFQLHEHRLGYNRLSKLLGKNTGFMAQQVKRKSPSVALFYALSIHLGMNLFEPFQNLLPENLRSTKRERELQQQIDELKKQLEDVTKERDFLSKIVMK